MLPSNGNNESINRRANKRALVTVDVTKGKRTGKSSTKNRMAGTCAPATVDVTKGLRMFRVRVHLRE